MTENEARATVETLVGVAAAERLARFAELVLAENDRQNLIARSTGASIWARHILDSIQLLQWAGETEGEWLDIGTGGGFPGLAIAIASAWPVVLVEPRRRRAAFLVDAAAQLGMTRVNVIQTNMERVNGLKAAVISARAVSSISSIFGMAHQCASATTRWLLPRGASHIDDVATAKKTWQGMFHVEHSLTDPAAGIVIATGVLPR